MITTVTDPRLRLFLNHYLMVRGNKRMPSRHDIDVIHLGPVLSAIWVNDYEPEAGTFRYRFAGEDVNAILGGSVAGSLLSDAVSEDYFPTVNKYFLKIIHEEMALLTSGPIYLGVQRVVMGERLALPLSNNGETADGIIGATACDALVSLGKTSLKQQQVDFISVEDLDGSGISRAAGD